MILNKLGYCDACFTDAIEIGEILKDYTLIFNNKTLKYIIVDNNGHGAFYEFVDKPVVEPPYDDTWFKWLSIVKLFVDDFLPKAIHTTMMGYSLIKAANAVGYRRDRHGYNFEMWLYKRAADMIDQWENQR